MSMDLDHDGMYSSTDIPVSQECRCKRFWFFHHDIRAFTTSWLPQPIFLAWRVFAAIYLLAWMIVHIVLRNDEFGVKWLTFYTDLAYLILVVAYIMLGLITLLYTIQYYSGRNISCSKTPGDYDTAPDVYDQDNISFLVKIAWAVWITSISSAPGVIVGYYGAVVDSFDDLDAAGVHLHGVNFIIILIDVFISRMPLHVLHFPWAGVFDVLYIIFTGIYFAAGGTHPDGSPFIYSVLDYGNAPGEAVGWALLLGLNSFIVHFIWWIIVFVRDLIYKTCKCCYRDVTKTSFVV